MENVYVKVVNENPTHGPDCFAAFDEGDAHFHIWLKVTYGPDGQICGKPDGMLYKNPLVQLAPGDPGYFYTRKLDPTKKANAAKIALLMKLVRDNDMIRKALVAFREDAADAQAAAEAAEVARYRGAIMAVADAQRWSYALWHQIEAMDDEQILDLGRAIRST